jgi:hypothetical protein
MTTFPSQIQIVVLNPTLASSVTVRPLASRPGSLRGKVLGSLWNNRARGDHILEGVAHELAERHSLAKVIHRKKDYIGEPSPPRLIEDLASSCDVVITALGN